MTEYVLSGDALLCEAVEDADDGGLFLGVETLPRYRVLKAGNPAFRPEIAEGDVIVCSTRGDGFDAGGRRLHMFSYDKVIGKIAK